MTETVAKKQKMSGPLIGTHSGHFHADESLAVYMLRLLPTYASSPLVRTRDPEVLKGCHTVVDVGGQYDDATRRYDHHQREFATTFPGRSTKLSSAGLVYMHLGKAIIAQQTGLSETSAETQTLYEKLYDDFVEAFDANDNGVSPYDMQKLRDLGVDKRYNDRGFSIASVVNRFNHDHSAEAQGGEEGGESEKTKEQLQAEEDARFQKASDFTGSQFVSELASAFRSWLPARGEVIKAFEARSQYDAQGRILVLQESVPWHDHLYTIEEENGVKGNVLYTLFPESPEPGSKWRVRAVSISPEGFELRKPLPEKWRGVRDQELSSVAGVEGCVFVHASGFIGGNSSFQGALKMAQTALEMS